MGESVTDLYSAYLLVCFIALMTFTFRALPFIFNRILQDNSWIESIRQYLPASIMVLLVLYTLKDVSLVSTPYGFNQIISIICVTLIHLKWRNTLLSIAGGTVLFVLLTNSTGV